MIDSLTGRSSKVAAGILPACEPGFQPGGNLQSQAQEFGMVLSL